MMLQMTLDKVLRSGPESAARRHRRIREYLPSSKNGRRWSEIGAKSIVLVIYRVFNIPQACYFTAAWLGRADRKSVV